MTGKLILFAGEKGDFESNLTVRDYIAIKAMAAIIGIDGTSLSDEAIAHSAYLLADAMIAESQKEKP